MVSVRTNCPSKATKGRDLSLGGGPGDVVKRTLAGLSLSGRADETYLRTQMMGWTPPADGIEVPAWQWCATTTKAGDVRMQITTVGLDIAKNLFQVHGADAQGRVLLKRKLARGKVLEFFATLPACLVGLEACGAAPYRARELTRLGHPVQADAATVRAALRPDQQTRRGRCRGLLRGGAAPRHAFCPGKG